MCAFGIRYVQRILRAPALGFLAACVWGVSVAGATVYASAFPEITYERLSSMMKWYWKPPANEPQTNPEGKPIVYIEADSGPEDVYKAIYFKADIRGEDGNLKPDITKDNYLLDTSAVTVAPDHIEVHYRDAEGDRQGVSMDAYRGDVHATGTIHATHFVAHGGKLTALAEGEVSPTSQEGVNGAQLWQVLQRIGNIQRVGAHTAALAALHPLPYQPQDKLGFTVGFGRYKQASAMAAGAFYYPNEDVVMHAGVALGRGSSNVFNLGISFRSGRGAQETQPLSSDEREHFETIVRRLQAENQTLATTVAEQQVIIGEILLRLAAVDNR